MTAPKSPFPEKSVGTVVIALTGPSIIWALHFGLVYGIQPVFCVVLGGDLAGFWAQMAVLGITVAALLALLLLIFKPDVVLRLEREGAARTSAGSFLTRVMQLLALLSVFGVLLGGSAALFLPACAAIV
ncbi:MAG: hypothetical protein ACR65R_08550 [Methylomicrobium sp.]